MQCPNCNYKMDYIEPVCPRCRRSTDEEPIAPAPAPEPPSPSPVSEKAIRKMTRRLLKMPQVPHVRLPEEVFARPDLGWPLRLSLIAILLVSGLLILFVITAFIFQVSGNPLHRIQRIDVGDLIFFGLLLTYDIFAVIGLFRFKRWAFRLLVFRSIIALLNAMESGRLFTPVGMVIVLPYLLAVYFAWRKYPDLE